MLAKGQKISDRYLIMKTIGEGGMANVYLAYDTILERNVAVKVLRGDLASDEKFVRRFQREALQASSLNNENIVEVYDVGEDGGEYYIVMEYVQGKHLKNLIKKRGKLTISETVDILLQITSGLSVAHDQYLIHRDIKPQNIMILENGIVKITDFGIAIAMNSTQLTQTNSVMGSVHYLPPEQASGKGAILQSDIYSLGILMYELLTGKLPFKGDNAVEIALKHLKEPMPSIRKEIPDIPQSIENIIYKATAKNPKNRYNDAREMHEDLLTALDESRVNEEKYTYKFPDGDYDAPKVVNKSSKKTEEKEEISKKITKNDLKNDNKTLIVLASIFTGLVVIIATVMVLLPKITSTKQIKVPDVKNMELTSAIEKLEDSGFNVTENQIEQASSTVKEGKVIKTSPAAGTKHKKGYDITIYVSSGNKEIEIEDFTGQDFNYVKGLLKGKGLQVFSKTRALEEDEEYEENTIIEQSVEPGKTLVSGDEITFTIPSNDEYYPDFTDGAYTVADVVEFCSEKSIKCVFKDEEGNNLNINDNNYMEYDDYKIKSQIRPAGSKVVPGATQTLTLNVGGSSNDGNGLN